MMYFINKRIAVVSAAVAGIIALLTLLKFTVHIYGGEYYIAPTCDMGGGTYEKCVFCGMEKCLEQESPKGHNGAWIIRKQPTAATSGEQELRCSVCKKQLDLLKIPAKESPIPSLKLMGSGVGMTDTNAIAATFVYTDGVSEEGGEGSATSGGANVRLMQGELPNTSKHSYVLTNFKLTEGDTLLFGAFGDCSEIHLYSNNDDYTRARRIVALRQWRDLVVENYPVYAKFISVSDDMEYAGYNMLMYIKSTKQDYSFAGIYTLSVPYSTIAEKNTDAGIKSVIKQTIHSSGEQNLRQIFGNDSESEKYRASLEKLLSQPELVDALSDINVIIDYYTFAQLTGNSDAMTELYWVTADGVKWYPVPADTEHTYGCVNGTSDISDPNYDIKLDTFWNGIFEANRARIKKRITELSTGRLSADNIKKEFNVAITKLDEEVYREDANTYRAKYRAPSDEVANLVEWYENRVAFLYSANQ